MYSPTIVKSAEDVESLVNADPVQVAVGGSLTTMIGKKITIMCAAEGIPYPIERWTLDGNVISFTENMFVQRYENGSSALVIVESMPANSGMYVCIAVNQMGQDEASTVLSVLGKIALIFV